MPQSSAFMLQPVNSAESGQKLLQFLTRRFTLVQGDLPASMVHRWIRTGQIRCNGKRCKAFQHVLEGDIIRLPPFALEMFAPAGLSPASQAPESPQVHALTPPLAPLPHILHESPHLLVLNKMGGLPVHTGTGHSDSVATRLHAHYAEAPFSPTPAHRLDKETSGLLLVARTYTMLRFLQQAFADHRMGKEYLAWVEGLWPMDSPPQELCDNIAKQYAGAYAKVERLPPASRSPQSPPDSTSARAIMHCVEQRGPYSLMHIRLLTGKTHQIRVQLASRGFPLCGDVKYGSTGRPPFKLHAMRLTLPPLDWPEASSHAVPSLECLPPWQGRWQVDSLPPSLPSA